MRSAAAMAHISCVSFTTTMEGRMVMGLSERERCERAKTTTARIDSCCTADGSKDEGTKTVKCSVKGGAEEDELL